MDWRIIVGFAFLFIPIIIFIVNAYLTTPSPSNTEVEFPYAITINPSILNQGDQSNMIFEILNSSQAETASLTVITPSGLKSESPIETGVSYNFPKDFNISATVPGTYEFIVTSESSNSKLLIDKTVNMTSYNPLTPLANGSGNAILLLMLGAIPTFWNYFQDLGNKKTLQKDRKLNYTQNNLTILFDFINSCRHVEKKRNELNYLDDNTIKDFVLSLLLQKCFQTKFNHYYLDNLKMEGFLIKLENLIMKQRDDLLGLNTYDLRFLDRQVSLHIEVAYRQGKLKSEPGDGIFNKIFDIYVNEIKSRLPRSQFQDFLDLFARNCALYSHEFEKEINLILSISYSNENDIKDRNEAADIGFYTGKMISHIAYLMAEFPDLVKSNQFPVLCKNKSRI